MKQIYLVYATEEHKWKLTIRYGYVDKESFRTEYKTVRLFEEYREAEQAVRFLIRKRTPASRSGFFRSLRPVSHGHHLQPRHHRSQF